MSDDEEYVVLPAVSLDAQICTKKMTDEYERVLLLRFYSDCQEVEGIIIDDISNGSEELELNDDGIWEAIRVLRSIESEWIQGTQQKNTPVSLVKKFGRFVGSPIAYISSTSSAEKREYTGDSSNKRNPFFDFPDSSDEVRTFLFL